MLEVLLTAIPSLCWMLYRCFQLYKTPTNKLGSSLNLDIPHTPLICFDFLSDNSVILHWDIETLPEENIFYVILINGKDAGTLAQQAVKLTNLDSDTLYRIHIVAINVISNFRSQSDAVYFRTLPKGNLQSKTYISRKSNVFYDPKKHAEKYNLGLSVSDAEELGEQETLMSKLFALQVELVRLSKEFSQNSTSLQLEERQLRDEIQVYKRELNDSAEIRARKETDLKQLEQKKDLLTFQRLKLLKQLRNHNSQKNINLSKLAELKLKVTKLSEKSHHVQNVANSERDKTINSVKVMNRDINDIKGEINKIEDSIKQIKAEKKEISATIAQLKPLVEQFTKSKTSSDIRGGQDLTKQKLSAIFNLDGGLTDLGNELLEKVYLLLPSWAQAMNHELETLHGLESSWKNTFRLSLRKYLSVYNSLEAVRSAADPSYVPQRKSEYQASLEFGGQAYALPKPASLSGDLDSSSDINDLLADNWYDLSRTNDNNSPALSAQVSILNLPSMLHVSEATVAPSSSFLSQQKYPEFEPYLRPSENVSVEGWNNTTQITPMNFASQQNEVYSAQMVDTSLVSGPQVFAPNYSDLQSMVTGRQILANALSPPTLKQSLSQNSQNSQPRISSEFIDPNYLSHDVHQNFPTQLFGLAMFPYGESTHLSGTPPDNNFLYPSNQSSNLQNLLWNNNSQSSFVDTRRQFPNLTLPKANQLSPTISQQSNMGTDRVFGKHEKLYGDTRAFSDSQSLKDVNHFNEHQMYGDNMLYNSSSFLNKLSFPQSSIWLENPMAPSFSHNRTESTGSHLWKNDIQRADKRITNEFSPFLQNDSGNDNFDIRLI